MRVVAVPNVLCTLRLRGDAANRLRAADGRTPRKPLFLACLAAFRAARTHHVDHSPAPRAPDGAARNERVLDVALDHTAPVAQAARPLSPPQISEHHVHGVEFARHERVFFPVFFPRRFEWLKSHNRPA